MTTQCNSLSYVCTQGGHNIPGHTSLCESDCSFVGSSSKLQSLNTVLIAIIIFNSNLIKKLYNMTTQCKSLSYVCTQGSHNIPGHTCHTFGHHSWPCKDMSQRSQYKFHLLCRWCDSRMEYSLGNHSNHCYTWNIKSEVQLIEVTNIY